MTVVHAAQKGLAAARYAKAHGMARGDPLGALAYAEGNLYAWSDTRSTIEGLKSAVSAMSTDDAGGLAASRTLTNDFLELVRPRSLLDRISGWRRAPMNSSILHFAGDATGYIATQGSPKPLAAFSLDRVTLAPKKAAAMIVITDETLRNSDPAVELSIGVELAKALGGALDRAAFGADVSGSIAQGATVINSTGSTLAAIDNDLRQLISTFAAADGALDTAVFVMRPETAAYLGSLRGSGGAAAFSLVGARGGSILQIPVYVSSSLTAVGSPGEGQITLFDPAQVLLADEGKADIKSTQNASLQMVSDPASGATSTISMFQSNLTCLLAERWLSWMRASTTAVATIDNVAY